MIDFAKITVKAGSGGAGAASFRHIKGKRYGKADGGNGGNGGRVYLEAARDLNTLESYRFVKYYKAENGQNGSSNLRRGADGQDLVLKVPVGTVVKIENWQKNTSGASAVSSAESVSSLVPSAVDGGSPEVEFDLTEPGRRILIAGGGRGGRGNAHLRDEFGRRPRKGESGQAGEELNLTLELKLIADIGLIGFPNAGKSTLLTALTSARPKIADYPFTTLEPNLGMLTASGEGTTDSFSVIPAPSKGGSAFGGKAGIQIPDPAESEARLRREVGDDKHKKTRDSRLVLADIPGLIEGASKGKGLGDLFLRHIERTKVLAHLISLVKVESQLPAPDFDSDSESLWRHYQTVRNELKAYSKSLAGKPEIIVLTKADLVNQSEVAAALNLFKQRKKRVIAISAVKNQGLAGLVKIIIKLLAASR